MDVLTEEKMRVLLLKDRNNDGVTVYTQSEDMRMSYSTLINWCNNILRFPNRSNSTSIRILQYLQDKGYITIEIHNSPIIKPF